MKNKLLTLACAATLSLVALPAAAQSYTNSYVARDGTVVTTDRYGRTTYTMPSTQGRYNYDNRYDQNRYNRYSHGNSYNNQPTTIIHNGQRYVRDSYGNYQLERNYYGNDRYSNDRYSNDRYYGQSGYNNSNYYYGSRYVRHNGRSYDQCSSRDRNAAAAVGLVLGGVIGNQVSDSPAGAAIGAIIGGAVLREVSGNRQFCN